MKLALTRPSSLMNFGTAYSICNHTRDQQIGLPLRGRPILFITRMITDRIGLHSAPLPLFIISLSQYARCDWSI